MEKQKAPPPFSMLAAKKWLKIKLLIQCKRPQLQPTARREQQHDITKYNMRKFLQQVGLHKVRTKIAFGEITQEDLNKQFRTHRRKGI